jgi:hypothetical protein
MKDPSKKIRKLVEKLQDGKQGKLEGGFLLLLNNVQAVAIIGGSEETNNCNGGNCATGCGLNTATGCGGTVNSVRGCGTLAAQLSPSF